MTKKLTEAELKRIIEDHRVWLLSEGRRGKQACFRNVDLSETNISHLNLSNADFREANLINANLQESDLRYADLYGANLSYADLYGANLSHALLIVNANLSYANLSYADLSYAKAGYSNLTNADLKNANLSHAKFSHTNLSSANLSYANLTDTSLLNANLSNADLSHSNLQRCELTGARLFGVNREAWNIESIICDFVFFDEQGNVRTPENRKFDDGEFEKKYAQIERCREMVLRLCMSDITYYAGLLTQWKLNHTFPDSEIKFKALEVHSADTTRLIFVDHISDEARGRAIQDKIEAIRDSINTFAGLGGLVSSADERQEKGESQPTKMEPCLFPQGDKPEDVEQQLIDRSGMLLAMQKRLWHAIESAF